MQKSEAGLRSVARQEHMTQFPEVRKSAQIILTSVEQLPLSPDQAMLALTAAKHKFFTIYCSGHVLNSIKSILMLEVKLACGICSSIQFNNFAIIS